MVIDTPALETLEEAIAAHHSILKRIISLRDQNSPEPRRSDGLDKEVGLVPRVHIPIKTRATLRILFAC